MPVYSSHLGDYGDLEVKEHLRDTRRQKGLSLRQLAAMAQLSAATLSNIETGKKVPKLVEVAAIAAALGVEIETLIPRSAQHHFLITRDQGNEQLEAEAKRLTGHERHHNFSWPLADAFVGKHILPQLLQINPLPDEDIHFMAHHHQEFIFVLKGEVESILKTAEGVIRNRLQPGDSMLFHSYVPHCHRSVSAEPAKVLNVIYSLRGGIQSEEEFGSFTNSFYRRGTYSDVGVEAGNKVTWLRKSHGWSHAELATTLGIQPRLLANIESGKTAIELDLLFRLALVFRRPIEYFFATSLGSQSHCLVLRREQITNLPPRQRRSPAVASGVSCWYRSLGQDFPDPGMYPYYVQFEPEVSRNRHLSQHHGQEFVYVLGGEVELLTYVGAEPITKVLRPGDSLFLESGAPHLLRSNSQNPYATTSAEIIDVFWSPLGEDYLFGKPLDDDLDASAITKSRVSR